MSGVGLSRRIDQALALDRSADSVRAVKAAVISELRALDPHVRVKSTEYFNHSYVPDLVASWPSSSREEERFIYLKFNAELDYLFDDLTLVKDKEPIIFGLGATPRADQLDLRRLTEASLESNTLVTDAGGLEALVQRRSTRFFELVTSALAQGGRGLLDKPAAVETAVSLSSGFEGARRTETKSTGLAAATIEMYLDQMHASPIMRLLQAVWIGSGGRIDNFPGKRDLAGGIADDALQFLLQLDLIDDLEFWRRLGSRVPFDQLTRLDLPAGSPNLDRMMAVSASVYGARYCRLRSEQRTLFDASRPPVFWFIDRRLLGLKGTNFAAYVTDHVENLSRVRVDRTGGIRLSELLRRAPEVDLNELEISVGNRAIRYSSDDNSDVAHDDMLNQLQSSMGGRPTVRSAAVMIDRVRLYCDFIAKTARGPINALIDLPRLLWTVIRLFEVPTVDEVEYLEELLPPSSLSVGEDSGPEIGE